MFGETDHTLIVSQLLNVNGSDSDTNFSLDLPTKPHASGDNGQDERTHQGAADKVEQYLVIADFSRVREDHD
jgi:hypothetical protein